MESFSWNAPLERPLPTKKGTNSYQWQSSGANQRFRLARMAALERPGGTFQRTKVRFPAAAPVNPCRQASRGWRGSIFPRVSGVIRRTSGENCFARQPDRVLARKQPLRHVDRRNPYCLITMGKKSDKGTSKAPISHRAVPSWLPSIGRNTPLWSAEGQVVGLPASIAGLAALNP